jgi:hypothetical protein
MRCFGTIQPVHNARRSAILQLRYKHSLRSGEGRCPSPEKPLPEPYASVLRCKFIEELRPPRKARRRMNVLMSRFIPEAK